jgi:hypothetical protein
MLDKIRALFVKPSAAGRDVQPEGEPDVADDRQVAGSRAACGRHRSDGDSATTTGAGSSEVFVGRVSGQDEGYAGTTGSEARARDDSDRD